MTVNTGWELFTVGGQGTTYRKTTAKAVTNTTAETDLLNSEITIPSNTMGTTNLLRLTAWGDWVQNSGASTDLPRLKVKLGSSVLLDTGVSGQAWVAASASRWGWRIVVEILETGATNSQSVTIDGSIAHLSPSPGAAVQGHAFTTGEGSTTIFGSVSSVPLRAVYLGWSSGAVDTTVSNALALTVINPTATATCETKLYGALVEII